MELLLYVHHRARSSMVRTVEPLVNPVDQNPGHINPDFNWSVDNTFRYKNVSLSFQFDGEVGGSQLDYVHKKMAQGGSDLLTDQGALGAARLPGLVKLRQTRL